MQPSWKGSSSATSAAHPPAGEKPIQAKDAPMTTKTVAPELAALNGPFTKIARAMSRHWNVRIVPSGARCDTDGATIRIPYTADYLPAEKRQALHGMLDHEVAHVAEERAAFAHDGEDNPSAGAFAAGTTST